MAYNHITPEELRKAIGHRDIDITLDLYRKHITKDEDELAELRDFMENPLHDTNVLSSLRDAAQKKLDSGDKSYRKILEALEG